MKKNKEAFQDQSIEQAMDEALTEIQINMKKAISVLHATMDRFNLDRVTLNQTQLNFLGNNMEQVARLLNVVGDYMHNSLELAEWSLDHD